MPKEPRERKSVVRRASAPAAHQVVGVDADGAVRDARTAARTAAPVSLRSAGKTFRAPSAPEWRVGVPAGEALPGLLPRDSFSGYARPVTVLPQRFVLDEPGSFLRLFRTEVPARIELRSVQIAQVWALVGLAALARRNGTAVTQLEFGPESPVGRFAHAIGLRDAMEGLASTSPGEPGRTCRIRRISRIDEVETAAREIAELVIPPAADDDEDAEARKTLRYVLVELMRNAVQHSLDPKGGVVAAQRMEAGYLKYPRPVVQVAVADAGVGVLAALQASYPSITDPEQALVKALEPHVSGTFGPGRTGSTYNAGMGLFFISEMAKLTAGRLVLASRGASLSLIGDLEGYAKSHLAFVPPRGTQFPGTLVAFELPLGEVSDHARLIEVIRDKARERTPQRDTTPWVRFEAPPRGVPSFVVAHVSEDVERAAELSRGELQRRLFDRKPVALDFRNISVCTQSFLHALLFEAIRISWAVQVPIFIEHAQPGVVAGIQLVDNYARGG